MLKTTSKMCLKNQGLFFLVFLLVLGIWLFKLNQSLFYTINSLHIYLPDKIWQGLNFIAAAKHFILPILLLGLTILFRRDKLFRVVILILAYYIVFAGLKLLISEARPFVVLPHNSFYFLGHEDSLKDAYRSFPSGHMGNITVFVFALLTLFLPNSTFAKIFLSLFLILIGLARICSGWHWPIDILASGLIAYILVKICLCLPKTP